MFSNKLLKKGAARLRISSRYRIDALIYDVVKLHSARFARPIMITETAGSRGSFARREEWLVQSVRDVKRLRAEGVPVVGYTWWPMISHIAWSYRQGVKDVVSYVEKMGLWISTSARTSPGSKLPWSGSIAS